MKTLYMIQILAAIFSFSTLLANGQILNTQPNCNTEQDSILKIIHANSRCSPLRSTLEQSRLHKMLMTYGKKTKIDTILNRVGQSLVELSYQTTTTSDRLQRLLVILDISSSNTFLPCSRTVDALLSRTAECNDSGLCIKGKLAAETNSNITFRCTETLSKALTTVQGILGLGLGPSSLLSQTKDLYQSTFSYCLPSDQSVNSSGSIRFGPSNQPSMMNTTKLLRSVRRPSFYYVELLGIMVDKQVVDIPPSAFAFDTNTGAGTIFDSVSAFTILVNTAYNAVRDEFRRLMGNATVFSAGDFDTCYNVPITIQSITFLFSGMNMTLPQDNFITGSADSSTFCLAMASAPATGENSILNVISNFQQQNFRVLIDGLNSKLGVMPETCGRYNL